MAGPITLEVVTPLGRWGVQGGLDEVVMRRREARFEQGSEIAVFPGHGPMLVRLPECDVRYARGSTMRHLVVGGGFAEVRDNHVTLLVPSARWA
jgi:F-type H+-transporting ATPase subunit epsilon